MSSNIDLEKAKRILKEKNLTCCLCKGDVVIESTDRGVMPLLKLIEEKKNLDGFSAADKIVGNAAAFLYALLGVKSVFANVMSTAAVKTLTAHNIENSCDLCVEKIINRKGDGICPIEEAVSCTSDPKTALERIKTRLAELQKKEG